MDEQALSCQHASKQGQQEKLTSNRIAVTVLGTQGRDLLRKEVDEGVDPVAAALLHGAVADIASLASNHMVIIIIVKAHGLDLGHHGGRRMLLMGSVGTSAFPVLGPGSGSRSAVGPMVLIVALGRSR